jgi:hypothetical protein
VNRLDPRHRERDFLGDANPLDRRDLYRGGSYSHRKATMGPIREVGRFRSIRTEGAAVLWN